jgi:hypothetical protein
MESKASAAPQATSPIDKTPPPVISAIFDILIEAELRRMREEKAASVKQDSTGTASLNFGAENA